jgi:hypothetical protein
MSSNDDHDQRSARWMLESSGYDGQRILEPEARLPYQVPCVANLACNIPHDGDRRDARLPAVFGGNLHHQHMLGQTLCPNGCPPGHTTGSSLIMQNLLQSDSTGVMSEGDRSRDGSDQGLCGSEQWNIGKRCQVQCIEFVA